MMKEEMMAKDDQKDSYKKFVLFAIGFFILILGITLVLVWWKDIVVLFKGAVGIILALAGIFMMYAVNKTR